jgi:hypothetical protein
VTHPILQGFDVADVILQVPRSKRVPEFMKEEIRAIRSFRTFITVLRDALPTIQFRAEGDALDLELVPLVWPPRFIRDERLFDQSRHHDRHHSC